MADRELETYVELGLPAWIATAKIGWKWKRTLLDRRKQYVDDVVEASGADRAELLDQLEDNRHRDVFVKGLTRSGDVGDPEYRSALANVVGAVFHDDAKVDELEHLTAQLVSLEPVDLRVLRVFARRNDQGEVLIHSGDGLPRVHQQITPRSLSETLDVSRPLARAALDRLTSQGFLMPEPQSTAENRRAEDESVAKGRGVPFRFGRYKPTDWGRRALQLCLGIAEPPPDADQA